MKTFIFLSAFVLLLSACSTPQNGPLPEPEARVFSGTAAGYTAGARELVAVVLLDDGEIAVGSGSIGADGAFSYELPEALGQEALLPIAGEFCEGLNYSEPEAQAAVVFSIDVLGDDEVWLGELVQATTAGVADRTDLTDGAVVVRRVYVDRDVLVTGACEFSPDTYDLSLVEGWNVVLETYREVEAGAFAVDSTTGAVPAGAQWFFVD